MTVEFRTMEPRDRDFVISAWSSSYKGSHFAGMLYTEDYADVMHKQIARVLDRAGTTTKIAYEKKAREFVYGFIAGDVSGISGSQVEPTADMPNPRTAPVVFYVYVKSAYRTQHIARGLFGALGVDPKEPFLYSCRTEVCRRFGGAIPLGKWDPLIPRFPKPKTE